MNQFNDKAAQEFKTNPAQPRQIVGRELYMLCQDVHEEYLGAQATLLQTRAELRAKALRNYLAQAADEGLQTELSGLLQHIALLEATEAALKPFYDIYTTWGVPEDEPHGYNRADAALSTADASVLVAQQWYLTRSDRRERDVKVANVEVPPEEPFDESEEFAQAVSVRTSALLLTQPELKVSDAVRQAAREITAEREQDTRA